MCLLVRQGKKEYRVIDRDEMEKRKGEEKTRRIEWKNKMKATKTKIQRQKNF